MGPTFNDRVGKGTLCRYAAPDHLQNRILRYSCCKAWRREEEGGRSKRAMFIEAWRLGLGIDLMSSICSIATWRPPYAVCVPQIR